MRARLDLTDSSSSVPLILRGMARILPLAQALREPGGRVGGRGVLNGAGSGRVGFGRSSLIQIYTTASFENRTQRGSSREKARNPAESLALARLHPNGKWNGVLLNGLKVVLQCALRMTWRGRHPIVKRLCGEHPDGVKVPAKEMKEVETRLERSKTLPKYDIAIKPRITQRQVN